MSPFLVELRHPGRPPAVMSLELYLQLPDDMVDGTAHLVFTCDRCHVQHELGSFAEVVAALGAVEGRVARAYSEACTVRRTDS